MACLLLPGRLMARVLPLAVMMAYCKYGTLLVDRTLLPIIVAARFSMDYPGLLIIGVLQFRLEGAEHWCWMRTQGILSIPIQLDRVAPQRSRGLQMENISLPEV